MVFDTGVFIEFLAGTRLGASIREPLKSGSIRASTTELNIAELRYILCRRVGRRSSSEIIGKLVRSGYFRVFPVSELVEYASEIKCERALSLVDCFTIALGEKLDVNVAFARHERELDEEANRRPFKAKLIFLEDLVQLNKTRR